MCIRDRCRSTRRPVLQGFGRKLEEGMMLVTMLCKICGTAQRASCTAQFQSHACTVLKFWTQSLTVTLNLTLNFILILTLAMILHSATCYCVQQLCNGYCWVSPERDYVTFGSAIANPSVVCNVGAPYSGDWNFRLYFFAILYVSHPLTPTQKFTETVPGNPSIGGIKCKKGSKIEQCQYITWWWDSCSV